MQALDRLAERLQRAGHVAVGPGRQPEEPGRTTLGEVVVRAGEVEGGTGVPGGAGHVALRLGQRRPVDGDGGRQGALLRGVGPGAHPGGRGRGERTLGVVEPWGCGAEVAGDHRDRGGEDAEHRAAPHRVVGQRRQPPADLRLLPVPPDLGHRGLDEGRGPVEVPGRQGVSDGRVDQVVLLAPGAGAPVQQRHEVGLLGQQARPQHVGEQLVVAVPLATVVERHEEEVGAVEVVQHPGCVVGADDGVAQGAAEPVEHRRAQQEVTHRRRLVGEHLLDEVVDDVAVVTGEPGDEARDVRAALQRDGGQLERGDPPLGAVLEGAHLLGGEPHAGGLVEVGRGLAGGEPQVDGPHLDELAAGPPPRQWQVGVGAGAEHDVHVRGQVVDEEGHPRGHPRVVGQVVVVQHQPHLVGCLRQLVEQRGEHEVGRHRRGEQLQRPGAQARHGAPEGGGHAGPEGGGVGVRRVERQPRDDVGGVLLRQPRREQRRLAEPRGGRHQGQPAAHPAGHPVEQPGARHHTGPHGRHVQLGRHQRERHVSSFHQPASSGRGPPYAVASRHPVRNREARPAARP